jgi:hypothetical protein
VIPDVWVSADDSTGRSTLGGQLGVTPDRVYPVVTDSSPCRKAGRRTSFVGSPFSSRRRIRPGFRARRNVSHTQITLLLLIIIIVIIIIRYTIYGLATNVCTSRWRAWCRWSVSKAAKLIQPSPSPVEPWYGTQAVALTALPRSLNAPLGHSVFRRIVPQ